MNITGYEVRQALDALVAMQMEMKNHTGNFWCDPEIDDAIATLKEALARPSGEGQGDAARLKIYEEAITAMVEDGWLAHGPEGMSDAQTKLHAAIQANTKEKP